MADPQSTYNVTFDDTSPVIKYTPYSDGDFTAGWQQWYSGNGFNNATGEDGIGDSFHISSFTGAGFQLSFFGVGVELRGTRNRTIEVELDGSISAIGSPPPDVLYSIAGLSVSSHTVQLTLAQDTSDGLVQFDSAIVFSSPPSGSQGSPSSVRIDNQNTSIISYAPGMWTTKNAHQVPSPQHPAPFQQTKVLDAWASMNFTGRAIAINGMINFGWWTYEVNLDGTTYSGFNASTYWIAPDATIFYQDGLDETVPHTINITNTASGMDLALNSFTVFGFNSPAAGSPPSTVSPSSLSPSTSNAPEHHHSGLSAGAVAGLVVGIAIVVAILVGAILVCRRTRARHTANIEPHPTAILQTQSMTDLVVTPFSTEKPHGAFREENGIPGVGPSSFGRLETPDGIQSSSSFSDSSYALPSVVPASATRSARPALPSSALLPSDRGGTPVSSPPRIRADTDDDAAFDRIANLVTERLTQRLHPQNSEGRSTPPPEYQAMQRTSLAPQDNVQVEEGVGKLGSR